MKQYKHQLIRGTIQVLAFLAFPESFAISLFALKRVVTLLASGSWKGLADPLVLLAATVPAVIFLGRYYCGFLCSFGAMQDLLYSFPGRWLGKVKIKMKTDAFLCKIKYVVLLFILFSTTMRISVDAKFSPWAVFALLADGSHASWSQLISAGGLILLAIVLASLVMYRPFCRYLCPMGAVYELLSLWSADRRSKPNQGKHCSGNCCICPVHCPKQRVSYVRLIIAIVLFLLVNLLLVNLVHTGSSSGQLAVEREDEGIYQDGEYTGRAEGFRGKTEVQVSIEQGYVSAISVEAYEDDRSYMESVMAELIPQILSEQNAEIDTVSGATYSSRGLLQAIEQALLCASISEEGAVSEDTEAAVRDFSSLEDGTYEGTAVGFRGDLTLTVTVDQAKVTDIKLLSYYDNEEYLFHACSTVFDGIIENQSLNVDVVTGATYSRNGLVKAVADALNLDESTYELAEARPRADKNKEGHHVTQKFVESDEQYQKLIEKYRKLKFGPDGLRIK